MPNDLANLKTEVDKIDTDKLKTVPNDLPNLKTEVDKIDTDKLKAVANDLAKLSNVVKNDVYNMMYRTEYNT